jgi:hypothetical protein
MPVFPQASQNITAAAMIMRTDPKPSTDEVKHIHQELRDMLETTAVQQVLKLHGEVASQGYLRTHLLGAWCPRGVPRAKHATTRR